MTEGSRCNCFPSSFTLTFPHSRPKYTNMDLALIHFLCRPVFVKSFSVAPYAFATIASKAASLMRGLGIAISRSPCTRSSMH